MPNDHWAPGDRLAHALRSAAPPSRAPSGCQVDLRAALSHHGRPYWWLGLILGVLELLLGIWAAGYPGRSLFVFVNLVGVYAIFYGFTELFAAFDLRGLGRRLERPRPATPAQ